MGNMGAMAGLLAKIQNEMKAAVSEAATKTFEAAQTELNASYTGGQPVQYNRTGQLQSSVTTTGVVGGGNEVSATIYLNDGYSYNTGTYSASQVMSEAEHGGSGIVLTPGFWQRTEQKAQQYVKEAFLKRFK